MANPFDNESSAYTVVVNATGHHSLWPQTWKVPAAWSPAGFSGRRDECLKWIEAHWRDMIVRIPQSAQDRVTLPSSECCVHELFEQTVAERPDAQALISTDRALTYRQLNVRANCIARQLRNLGVKPETLVGVYVERSVDAVTAFLGVLKAGAGCVPLDPTHPRNVLHHILLDSRLNIVVTRDSLTSHIPEIVRSISVDHIEGRLEAGDQLNPAREATPDNVAYVMYTSGSTGTPKGVVRIHRDLIGAQPWAIFGSEDVCALNLSLAGGFAVIRLFLPLISGIPIVVLSDEEARNTTTLIRILEESRVTNIAFLPSFLRRLLEAGSPSPAFLPALRIVAAGGEPVPTDLVSPFRQVLPHARLFNHYASSETGPAAVGEVNTRGGSTMSVGTPVAGTHIYILDDQLRQVGNNGCGEIYISSSRLARGYLNRPTLTATRFVPNPFSTTADRLYRSGDLGRYIAGGEIEHLGRVDHQMNIQGFSIDPQEIEQALRKHADVREALVAAQEVGGAATLVAYIVPAPGIEPRSTTLKDYLATQLPTHKIPSLFLILESLPTTRTGKPDRSALPVPGRISEAAQTQ